VTHGKSVVVPVEPSGPIKTAISAAIRKHVIGTRDGGVAVDNGLARLIWQDAIAAAPAPSLLAGGEDSAFKVATDLHAAYEALIYGLPKYLEVENLTDEENMIREAWIKLDVTAHRLAALSPEAPMEGFMATLTDKQRVSALTYTGPDSHPEAPAQEGVTRWDRASIEKLFEPLRSDDDERYGNVVNGTLDDAREAILAALTPRHEAPADDMADPDCRGCGGGDKVPAGSDYWCCPVCDTEWHGDDEAPAEGAGELMDAAESIHAAALIYEDQALLDDAEIVLKHLRARSSAPEAREPVAWTGSGSLARIKGKGGNFQGYIYGTPDAAHPIALYTYPVAPIPDKLRIATDAFDAITDLGRALRSGGPDSSDLNDLSDNLDSAVNIAAEALAALKAEGV